MLRIDDAETAEYTSDGELPPSKPKVASPVDPALRMIQISTATGKGRDAYVVSVAERRLCHPERSEGSRNAEILRSAQNDDEPTTAFRNGNYVTSSDVQEPQRVLTEHDITQNRYKADGVAEGSYGVDCHIIQELTVNGKRVADTTRHVLIAGYDIR